MNRDPFATTSWDSREDNPYVGPRAFRSGERLYGRGREARDLLDLLIAERIVLLYSPSGAGKSSLINARLVPNLGEEDFLVLGVGRVAGDIPSDLKIPKTANHYLVSLVLSLEESLPKDRRTPVDIIEQLDLKAYLDYRRRDDPSSSAILILDQFEEILTLDPTDQAAKQEFFETLGAALRDPDLWALFAMREDFLAGLDPYRRYLPTRLEVHFRLDLLRPVAARRAIRRPALAQEVSFQEEAVALLVDNLRQTQVANPDGSQETKLGPYVEPVQLQVVCHRLWEKLPENTSEITMAHVGQVGSVDEALAGYYSNRVKVIAQRTGTSERRIRLWFQFCLITENGYRAQVPLGAEKSQGLENEAIQGLVDAYLVRAEPRRGTTWFELSHDRMIEPIRAGNEAWRLKNLSPVEQHALDWEGNRRADRYLLREGALEQAEVWAATHQEFLRPLERDYLEASRQFQNHLEVKRQRTRVRWNTLIIAFLVATVIGLWASLTRARIQVDLEQAESARSEVLEELKQAKLERAAAIDTRDKARQEADRLIAAAELRARETQERIQQQLDASMKRQQEAQRRLEAAEREATAFREAKRKAEAELESFSQEADSQKRLLRADLDRKRSEAKRLKERNIALNVAKRVPTLMDGQTAGPLAYAALNLFRQNHAPDFTIPVDFYQALISALQLLEYPFQSLLPIGAEDTIRALALHPETGVLAVGGDRGRVAIWTPVRTETLLDHLVEFEMGSPIRELLFAPNHHDLIIGTSDGAIAIWKKPYIRTKPETIVKLPTNSIWRMALSHDGQWLATLGRNGWLTLHSRNPDNGSITSDPNFPSAPEPVRAMAFQPNLPNLVLGGESGGIHLIRCGVQGTAPVRLFQFPSASADTEPENLTLTSLAMNEAGLLAVGTSGHGIKILELEDRAAKAKHHLPHDFPVFDLHMFPDGRLLSAGGSGAVNLWIDPRNSQEAIELGSHGAWAMVLAASHDGGTAFSGGADGTVRPWLASTDALADAICPLVREPISEKTWRTFFYDLPFNPPCQTDP
ncbi:hypothetical protein SCOR_18810 [Sulfidibacter corallicola]|uniref:Novel STAND NTPase 1 domain-containing protein n=1 Tax=Sulfidibacter corallicola TaxID=2818388 RepID=A0A8A4TX03_SULCO|nr:hypothetical protein [Sulfidibacter corallicola]QTD53502.1 hypothetical protein J3U87_13690 [Sulfidibacter corallicola]